jgi:photosystem II stability/assembly factor-like uncharacterized protein
VLIVAGVAVVALVAVVWAVQRGGDHDDQVVSQEDPGVTHVHGLGVDPADGTLYAATHHGVFRIPEQGQATRVADRFQDTMGFTVTGPNRFLASGHPDFSDKELFQEGRDPHLGLIQSTDAGQTWKALSLLGEADFHGLAAAHGRIYGYSATSGEFMVSPDGKTWDRRSRIGLVSFAVDPDDPEHVVATTQTGLVASTDGGRNWQPVAGPALAFLSWDREGGLWGAGPDGGVHRSVDRGSTWELQGRLPGTPEALLVDGSALYAAVSEEGIFRSHDSGRTWQLRYRDP